MDERYNFSLTTFSPNGKLGQIEHALKAVENGLTSVGIKTKTGVVIAAEKRAKNILVDVDRLEKCYTICPTIGVVYSGLNPDARLLMKKARRYVHTQQMRMGEWPSINIFVNEMANIMQEYTQSGGVRPFGVSLLAIGPGEYEENGNTRKMKLYQIDPSGLFFSWKATAIGNNYVSARAFLERRYSEDMVLEDAVHTAILALKEGYEGVMTENNVEVGIISAKTCKFERIEKSVIADYLSMLK